MIAPDTMREPSSVALDSGAARSRRHRPRWRSVRMPTAFSIAPIRMNCTAIPATAWAAPS